MNFWQKDKLEHFTLLGILTVLIYIMLFAIFTITSYKHPDLSGLISAVVVLILGFGLELLQLYLKKTSNKKVKVFFAKLGINGTGFSLGDIGADFLGIIAGLITGKLILVISYLVGGI